jgi:hypothetical protein
MPCPRRSWRWLFAGLLALAGAGCGPEDPQASQKALLERATAYWQARAAGDLPTLYRMESAALPGGWLKPGGVAGLGGQIVVTNPVIEKAKVEGDQGQVVVKADLRVPEMQFRSGFVGSQVTDRWVRVHGVWYHKTFDPKTMAGVGVTTRPDLKGQSPKAGEARLPTGAPPGKAAPATSGFTPAPLPRPK